MTDLRFDHLFRETNHSAGSVAWWSELGFTFVEQWGRETARQTGSEVVETHWGTRIVSGNDPEGCKYNFELGDSNT